MGHRYQKGALKWTLIFLYIMYLSTYFHRLIWNILGYDLCKKHDWNWCLLLVPKSGLAHGLIVWSTSLRQGCFVLRPRKKIKQES